jgi:hypothetical protein
MPFPLVCLALLLAAPAAARAVPKVDVDVSSLTFPGTVMVGLGSVELQFRLSSVGADPLRLWKWKLTGAHPADFVVAGCGFFQPPAHDMELQPGQWCPGQVGFRPTAPGPRSANLEIDTSDPQWPHIVIPLSGNAVPGAPDLRVTSTAVAFGLQPLHVLSAPRIVTLENVGSAPLTVASVTPPIRASRAPPLHGAGAGTSCPVEVKFQPELLTLHLSQLTIVTNDPQGDVVLPLSGTGAAQHLDVAPQFQFGSTIVGTPLPTTSSSTTSRRGHGTPARHGRQHLRAQAADFSAPPPGSCADVPEGGSCTLAVVFRRAARARALPTS